MAHESAKNPNLAEKGNTVVNVYLGKSKPSKWQWKLLQPAINPLESLVAEFLIPWRLLLCPIVQFASFVVSFSSTCYLMITFVQSEGLGGKPYHFGSLTVGFTNFTSLVGTLIGLFTAGPASDYISAVLTRRNNGIREPEMRLVTMIPYVLIMVLGNFVVAFGLQQSWDWRVSWACVFSSKELLTRNRRSSSYLVSLALAYKSLPFQPSQLPMLSTLTNPLLGRFLSRSQ